jgi:ribose transport system permease protein
VISFARGSSDDEVQPAAFWRPAVSLLTQPTLRVWALALALLIFYFALSPSSMNFTSINLLSENCLPLAWVAAGQMAVVMTAQIDLSVGSVMSLSTAIAATQMGSSGLDVALTCLATILVGAVIGSVNGFLVAYRGMSSFIVTIATWSIVDGLALLVLPSAGGSVPNGFATVINTISPVSFGAIALIASLVVWAWVRNTAGFMRLRAVGSSAEKAHWAGVSERRTMLMAFCFSGAAAACAGLVLAGITESGDPNIGTSYILNGLAVAVIGGVSLLGGSGSFAGVVGGAMVLTVINDVVFALGLTPYLEPAIVGGILALAVLTTGLGSRGAIAQRAGT